MMPTKPNSSTWILKFKHHRSTFLLHVDPIQTFSSVKSELLTAITETNTSGTFNGISIPQNPDDVLLARPVDIHDLSAGWETLALFSDRLDGDASGKGKGKASTTASGKAGGKGQLKDTPQGAGLRDGSIVAFKFRGVGDEEWQEVEKHGDDEDDEIVVAAEDMKRVEHWDVVVPTMEETYADQMEEVVDEGAVL